MLELFSNPMALALFSSSLFGMSMLTSRNGLQYFDPTTGVMISVGSTAVMYWLLSPMLLPPRFWMLPGFWIFCGLGFIHPFTTMSLSFESTRRLGATISATVSSVSPLLSALGAVALLGEAPTLGILTGTIGVVTGVMILSWRQSPGNHRIMDPQILIPLVLAALRGMVHVVAKYGMTVTPVPFIGPFATYSVASTLMISIKKLTGKMPGSFRSMGTFWFCITGIITGCAVLSMYHAFKLGDVVVVSPLVSSYPAFTLLGSLIFYPKDVLSWRILVGVAVVVGGVALISGQ